MDSEMGTKGLNYLVPCSVCGEFLTEVQVKRWLNIRKQLSHKKALPICGSECSYVSRRGYLGSGAGGRALLASLYQLEERIFRESSKLEFFVSEFRRKLVNQKKPAKEAVDTFLQTRIEELDISVRAENCLQSVGIKTVADILKFSKKDLFKQYNVGKKTIREIDNFLGEMGLHLKAGYGDVL